MGTETAGMLQFHYNSVLLLCHYVVFVFALAANNCVGLAANNLNRMTNKQTINSHSVRFSEAPRPHREEYRSSSFASDNYILHSSLSQLLLFLTANAHAHYVRASDSCV